MFNKNKEIVPLPYGVYFWTVFILGAAGLFDSIYLSISHYRVYVDLGYKSFCAISKSLNCDTVSQSPYSIFLGVPVPVWGIWGYLTFLFLTLFAKTPTAEKKRVWPLLFLISLVFSVYSIVLAFISTYSINSYCLMCIFSYAVNLLLLFYTWLIRRRFKGEKIVTGLKEDFRYLHSHKKLVFPVTVIMGSAAAVMILFFPTYWHLKSPPPAKTLAQGMTDEGHPWIGAKNPEITIVEFSDYQCFQCRKMHYYLRQLVSDQPERVRLVHRHFPMDHKFNPIVTEAYHEGSGYMAMVAVFAADAGKFWEMNDLLFDAAGRKENVRIRVLAERLGFTFEALQGSLQNRQIFKRVMKDIRDGLKLGLSGTPGFVIDGHIYSGMVPSEKLKNFIQ
jgi:uncharacterized membrane protein/protein-disulfide isomerase